MVITEKPDAALRIASAIDIREKPVKKYENGVPYYEAIRNEKLIVVPALGHLFTVTSESKQKKYPIFDIKWSPRYEVDKKAKKTKDWLKTIFNLSKKANRYIDACDYDIEGSIIGFCILKYACGDKEKVAKRMKYSTLTKDEIIEAYQNLLESLDFPLIESGLARHEIDWLYGINLTRALTDSTQATSNKFFIISTGRVQGPTLKFIKDKEEKIACFKSEPYWKVKGKIKIDNQSIEVEYYKKIFESKNNAVEIIESCNNQKGTIEKIESKKIIQQAPIPFNLGELQSTAYILFKYSPFYTLNIAQHLYLKALISYPRTDSQKLPKKIGYSTILKKLWNLKEYRGIIEKILNKKTLSPKEGKKDDPAHPAIYPTGKNPEGNLTISQRKIYDLIVKRFIAAFGSSAIQKETTVSVDIKENKFFFTGRQTLTEGWYQYYRPYSKLTDIPIPTTKEGQEIFFEMGVIKSNYTVPPKRYNANTLLKKMEKENIGTKATRAGIIKTLYERKYIKNKEISVTNLGIEVTNILEHYCPKVVSVNFTRKLDKRMLLIQKEKEKRVKLVSDIIDELKLIISKIKENEKDIGKSLHTAIKKIHQEEREIGQCILCDEGKLVLQYSKKTNKRFVGCTNYFVGKCKTTYSLPQKGRVRPSKKKCKKCGLQTIKISYNNYKWSNLCFNKECNKIKTETDKK